MKISIVGSILAACLMTGPAARAQKTASLEDSASYEKRMEWFCKAKLGIFIHWGIYAVRGVSESWSFYNEYLPYDEYMSQLKGFTAKKYDPKAWASLIKESEIGRAHV